MADTTISALSRILTTNTGAIIPISVDGVTSGIPVSGVITATGDIGGALPIPVGTSAQRPLSPSSGMLRFNTTLNTLEIYNNGYWLGLAQAPATGTVTQIYDYTGQDILFTVPAGITSINVKIWGAGGSSTTTTRAGGGGGYVSGLKTVSSGQNYIISVGGGASSAHIGGYNGGGSVGGSGYNVQYGCGGGGGYSGIFLGSKSFNTAVAIAGGGGGSGGQDGEGGGGPGGGNTGGEVPQGSIYWWYSCGKGGTQTAGGLGGQGTTIALYVGSQLQGGRGQPSGGYAPGGGGGGGYYGGGGGYGYSQQIASGSGGGGSGYVGGLTTVVNNLQGDSPSNQTGLPGNPNDPDRNGAGQGGKGVNVAGANGRIIISYTYPQ